MDSPRRRPPPTVFPPDIRLDTKWMIRGACNGLAGHLFFPERGESSKEAKAICAGCEVREHCLEHALVAGEKFGIWGGKSERERRRMRRDRRAMRGAA